MKLLAWPLVAALVASSGAAVADGPAPAQVVLSCEAVYETVLLTALDNERIQLDTASLTWRSDFRGQATSQGRCERR